MFLIDLESWTRNKEKSSGSEFSADRRPTSDFELTEKLTVKSVSIYSFVFFQLVFIEINRAPKVERRNISNAN